MFANLLLFKNGTGSHNGMKNLKKCHILVYKCNFRVTDLFAGQEISSGRGNAVMKIEFHCWLRT
jgi:hypothetical protein